MRHHALGQLGARLHLRRGRVLTDQPVFRHLLDPLGATGAGDVFGRRVKPHPDVDQPLADQIGLRRFLHPDRHIGLAHRQIQHALFQQKVDLQLGIAVVKLHQPRRQPHRAKADRGRHFQLAKDLFLAVADARGGGIELFRHRRGGVKQQFALFGQDQAAGVTVKEGGAQRFFQRPDLPADGRLRQVQRIARMGQRPGIRHRVEDAQLVPVHALHDATCSYLFCTGCISKSPSFHKWLSVKFTVSA